MFAIDPRLVEASQVVQSLDLCDLRLQNDARFPWVVLIPRRVALVELEDLADGERARLMTEILLAGAAVRVLGRDGGRPVEKLNVGALGNIVAQLHVHVVGRRSDDPAWPGPVWGAGAAEPYASEALQRAVATARSALAPAAG